MALVTRKYIATLKPVSSHAVYRSAPSTWITQRDESFLSSSFLFVYLSRLREKILQRGITNHHLAGPRRSLWAYYRDKT